jgi:hypothetical protein
MITVQADQTYCATAGVQCTQLGGTVDPVADGNGNPARLVFQVLRPNGQPAVGLQDLDFEIGVTMPPAGGASLVIESCASCFNNAGNGTYTLCVRPPNEIPWKSGMYASQLQITLGQFTARALFRVDVPH